MSVIGCTKEHKFYYESGELLNTYLTKNGEKEGKSITYLKNGQIKGIKVYRKGKLNGLTKVYFPNGSIMEERMFEDDKMISEKQYNNNGQITFFHSTPTANMYQYSEDLNHIEIQYLHEDESNRWDNDTTIKEPYLAFVFDSLEIYRKNKDSTKILTYMGLDKNKNVIKQHGIDELYIDTVNNAFIHQFRDSLKIKY